MDDIQQLLTRVLETHRTGDHDTARSECAEVLLQAPGVSDAHYVMGLLLQDDGNHEKAIQSIARAVDMEPDRSGFHDAMGVSQVSIGRHREGLRSFAQAVRLAPHNRLAVMHLGVLALRMGLVEQALPCFETLMNMGESSPELLSLRGEALHMLGRHTEAVEWLHKCLDLGPDNIHAHRYLGRSLLALNRYAEAVTCLRLVADAEIDNARVRTELGEALMNLRDFEEAERTLHEAIDLDHSQHKAHAFLGNVQAALGLTEAPLRSFLTALRLRPQDVDYRCQLGFLLVQQGYLPKAEHCFRLVLKQEPYNLDAIAGLASTLSKMGDPDAALAISEPMIQEGTDHPDLTHTYALLCRKLGRPHEAIPVLHRMLARSRPIAIRAQLQHALGELYEAAGQHDAAFAAHSRGNTQSEQRFDPDAFKASVDAMIDVFGQKKIDILARSNNLTRIPVLIVGMPRSGTTLVEQILATHPHLVGAGELEELQMLARAMPQIIGTEVPYPPCVSQLTPNVATHLSHWYTERMLTKGGDATRVTDKMPQNFMHLGLAALLLPNIRVIHCTRSPLDVALSCYFMHFKDSHAFSTRLDWLGKFYVQYRRVMEHWHKVLPLPILDVPYEDLVSYPETSMRRIVDFVGLPWHPACTRFYTNDREVLTASSDQVRQPIYTTSVQRHLPYLEHLRPFYAELEAAGIEWKPPTPHGH